MIDGIPHQPHQKDIVGWHGGSLGKLGRLQWLYSDSVWKSDSELAQTLVIWIDAIEFDPYYFR